jgi:C4-dicarboxylate-specific signal transduction histidine kinase
VPVKNELGQITGFIGTIQDITELHIKQSALMTSSRLSSLGEMASGVAHEINNPLTIIMSRAQRIESLLSVEKPDPKALVMQTDQIVKTAHRIAKIIKGLQSFARETTGEPFQVVPIKEVILNTVELCKERFSKHDVRLEYSQVIDENWRFWGREEQISQVLMNLLNNAYDAIQNETEKWVKIEVAHVESKLKISVTDSGHGIPEHVETKMFSPFYTTKEVGKGTGLGLSISKGIVERHGGVLYFDKTAKNTRFVLELNIY